MKRLLSILSPYFYCLAFWAAWFGLCWLGAAAWGAELDGWR